MKSALSFSISAAVFACTLAVGAAQSTLPKPVDATVADQYSVYSAALEQFVGYGYYVVAARTFIPVKPEKLDSALSFPVEDADHLSNDLVIDFKSKNERSESLGQHFPEGFHVAFLSDDERNKIFAKSIDEGWETFYQKYLGASGITELSRVGFNKERNTALVYVSNVRNGEVGGGAYLLLTKSDGKWKVISRSVGWIT